MSSSFAIAACALLIASTVQAATGFGFALVAGPALYAVVEPAAAVALVLVVGQVVNLLILFGERRRPEVDWTAVRPALAAAVPGLPVGALIVRAVPERAMRLFVGIAVCAIVVARLMRRRTPQQRDARVGPGAAVAAGFAVGVLTTSTTTNGPPLAIWLTARQMEPRMIRDVVSVIFLVLDAVGAAVLVAVSGTESLARVSWIPALIPMAIAGHFLGRQVFLRLPGRYYEPTVLSSALVAGALSIATGIAGR